MTQLQKWIFLAEETKTGVVSEEKKSPGSHFTLPFSKWHVLSETLFQPFLLALDLETHSLIGKEDLGPEVLPLGVHPFKAKAVF